MRLLLDTNVFLEVLLEQKRSEEAEKLLLSFDDHDFFISDFSLHSIGVLLFKRRMHETFLQLCSDLDSMDVHVLALSRGAMSTVVETAQAYNLDFDDGYQYVLAERENLSIVSFDPDFDKTPSRRKTPVEINA